MRKVLSRMFGKGRLVGTFDGIHVRINRPDKREVGSSTLPRPMDLRLTGIIGGATNIERIRVGSEPRVSVNSTPLNQRLQVHPTLGARSLL